MIALYRAEISFHNSSWKRMQIEKIFGSGIIFYMAAIDNKLLLLIEECEGDFRCAEVESITWIPKPVYFTKK